MGVYSLYNEWSGGRVFTVQWVEWWACPHCTVMCPLQMRSAKSTSDMISEQQTPVHPRVCGTTHHTTPHSTSPHSPHHRTPHHTQTTQTTQSYDVHSLFLSFSFSSLHRTRLNSHSHTHPFNVQHLTGTSTTPRSEAYTTPSKYKLIRRSVAHGMESDV